MITPVTYPDALDYWLKLANSCPDRISYEGIRSSPFFGKCNNELFLREARLYRLDPPLNILFPHAGNRIKTQALLPHVIPNGIPPSSFVQLSDYLYVICPELAFLLAAPDSSLVNLIRIGCDLCAIYRSDSFSNYAQVDRTPVTNQKNLSEYLANASNISGIKKARQAARYVLDNSNSPMESIIASVLNTPFFLGGGGMNDLHLNKIVRLSERGASSLGRSTCKVDIAYSSEKKAIEYDSNLVHLTPEQHAYDKKRVNALLLSGYEVFTITYDHLCSYDKIDELILDLRSFLGMRTKIDQFEKYKYVRWKVYDEMFPKFKLS